ncbi:MAG: pilus assembly protein PilM [Sedimentisphaerales bacterium]|nr:pilus assembly protein PilM [Sedimentisphaerales bacterium]
MLKLFRKKVYPIGIDLGSHSLKIIQVTESEGGLQLIAAAKAVVPPEIRNDPLGLQNWYITNIKELLAVKPFKGKKVVSCLPARTMLIQHLRLPRMEEKQLKKSLPWEAQEKLPFDVAGALLRHITAGEVYEGDETRLEVILLAASRNVVQQHLHLIEQTKIEIDSVSVEACALVNSFAHLQEHMEQGSRAILLVDLGHSCTKVVAVNGPKMTFCRTIGPCAEEVNGQGTMSDKKEAVVNSETGGSALAVETATATMTEKTRESGTVTNKADSNMGTALTELATEIRSCIRYHDILFETDPITRIIFVGGQAKDKQLCQRLAQELRLPAQLGDPLARIEAGSRIGRHSDLDAEQINSDWAVAFGLCLGENNYNL